LSEIGNELFDRAEHVAVAAKGHKRRAGIAFFRAVIANRAVSCSRNRKNIPARKENPSRRQRRWTLAHYRSMSWISEAKPGDGQPIIQHRAVWKAVA
jgi:hypothetical protein